MWKRRYAFEALLIAAVVAVALVIAAWGPPLWRDIFTARRGGPAPPQKPWAPSPEFDVQANADFAVESDRTANAPIAGKHIGSDWPMFAGSRRDNRSPETGLLPRWPAAGPPLAWMSRGLGNGFSSVAIVDGIVYTMGNKGSSETVIAIDAGTGERRRRLLRRDWRPARGRWLNCLGSQRGRK